MAKQNALLRALATRLRAPSLSSDDVGQIADSVDEILERAAGTRRMFAHLLDERSRTARGSFRAQEVARTVADQLRPLTRGVPIDVSGIPESLRLPSGGYAEWVAVLQNLYINGLNAMLDQAVQRIDVDGGYTDGLCWLRIQDTGVGVDLITADSLFKPFERRLQISLEREKLGLGGTGLGLTIVRMLADHIGFDVQFETPDSDHATAVSLKWRAKETR